MDFRPFIEILRVSTFNIFIPFFFIELYFFLSVFYFLQALNFAYSTHKKKDDLKSRESIKSVLNKLFSFLCEDKIGMIFDMLNLYFNKFIIFLLSKQCTPLP